MIRIGLMPVPPGFALPIDGYTHTVPPSWVDCFAADTALQSVLRVSLLPAARQQQRPDWLRCAGCQTAGSADWDSTIKSKLLSQYTYTSTNENAKATAYLLDKTQWSVFRNAEYAEYAIGGPTLELFAASYNKTHTTKTIETEASSSTGYKVKWSTDSSFSNNITGLDTDNDLYVLENANAFGMWVASPSAYKASYVMVVGSYGCVNSNPYSYAYNGARVLVSLKSNIRIEKIEEGRYQIVGTSGGSGDSGDSGNTGETNTIQSGINKTATKYVWRKASEGTPTKAEITEI